MYMCIGAQIVVGCASHRGSRELNEDSYLALVGDSAPCGTLGLLAVADGIGGMETGAQASRLALKTFSEAFAAGCSIASGTMSDVPHLLRFALQKANAAVFRARTEDKSLAGMGTTCVAAAVTDNVVHVVSIGDSRAYIFRQGNLIPLTKDDWVKQENGVTLVSRAIGWQPLLPVEPVSVELAPSDQLILCTDGLTDALSEETILDLLVTCDEGQLCPTLTTTAAECPSSDNVTVVVAKIAR